MANSYKTYYAESIEDIHDYINKFKNDYELGREPLWFRGHQDLRFSLLPRIYRDSELETKDNIRYESYSIEQFVAKAYDKLEVRTRDLMYHNDNLGCKVDIMHQSGMLTRLLDWTEQLNVALVFALRNYLDFDKRDMDNCREILPCIWC